MVIILVWTFGWAGFFLIWAALLQRGRVHGGRPHWMPCTARVSYANAIAGAVIGGAMLSAFWFDGLYWLLAIVVVAGLAGRIAYHLHQQDRRRFEG